MKIQCKNLFATKNKKSLFIFTVVAITYFLLKLSSNNNSSIEKKLTPKTKQETIKEVEFFLIRLYFFGKK